MDAIVLAAVVIEVTVAVLLVVAAVMVLMMAAVVVAAARDVHPDRDGGGVLVIQQRGEEARALAAEQAPAALGGDWSRPPEDLRYLPQPGSLVQYPLDLAHWVVAHGQPELALPLFEEAQARGAVFRDGDQDWFRACAEIADWACARRASQRMNWASGTVDATLDQLASGTLRPEEAVRKRQQSPFGTRPSARLALEVWGWPSRTPAQEALRLQLLTELLPGHGAELAQVVMAASPRLPPEVVRQALETLATQARNAGHLDEAYTRFERVRARSAKKDEQAGALWQMADIRSFPKRRIRSNPRKDVGPYWSNPSFH